MKDDYTTLVLYWNPDGAPMRAAIRHHLQAAGRLSQRGRVVSVNAFHPVPRWIRWMRFDAVVLHTTLLCLRWSDHFADYRWRLRWVRDVNCPTIAIPQDEYDHSELLDEWLADWNVDAVLTNFGEDVRELLYPICSQQARFYHAFTGYIDEQTAIACAAANRPLRSRENDLVYRACHLPFWFGRHGELKHRIASIVGDRAKQLGLRCDVSTRPEDTIHSNDWFSFLGSSRATIGVESGSSVLDRRGEIQSAVRHLLAADPELELRDLDRHLPAGWDDHKFFAISPRHFEAVLTRTCQILVEGRYDGCLEAGRHYIPLKADYSNLDEALELVRNDRCVEDLTQQAYKDLYLSGRFGYDRFAALLGRAIEESSHRRTRGIPVFSGRGVELAGRATASLQSGTRRFLETANAGVFHAIRRAARLTGLTRRSS